MVAAHNGRCIMVRGSRCPVLTELNLEPRPLNPEKARSSPWSCPGRRPFEPIAVFGAGECPGADLVPELPHGLEEDLAALRVALDELGRQVLVQPEQVMGDQDLPVARWPGPDADRRHV